MSAERRSSSMVKISGAACPWRVHHSAASCSASIFAAAASATMQSVLSLECPALNSPVTEEPYSTTAFKFPAAALFSFSTSSSNLFSIAPALRSRKTYQLPPAPPPPNPPPPNPPKPPPPPPPPPNPPPQELPPPPHDPPLPPLIMLPMTNHIHHGIPPLRPPLDGPPRRNRLAIIITTTISTIRGTTHASHGKVNSVPL